MRVQSEIWLLRPHLSANKDPFIHSYSIQTLVSRVDVECGRCSLVTIAGAIILKPVIFIISLQLLWRLSTHWRLGTCPFHLSETNLQRVTGPWFNIKMSSYQYRKSHCGDKTVVRSSYLHNGISYTGKMTSLYWIRALIFQWVSHAP